MEMAKEAGMPLKKLDFLNELIGWSVVQTSAIHYDQKLIPVVAGTVY